MNDDKNKNQNGIDDIDLGLDFDQEAEGAVRHAAGQTGSSLMKALVDDPADASSREDEKYLKIPQSKVIILRKILEGIRDNLGSALSILADPDTETSMKAGKALVVDHAIPDKMIASQRESRVIEGVFDGEMMVGPDGKQYSIPANYASKSKLVEGDMLKLTIAPSGTFMYKQIGPVERTRIAGTLAEDANGNFHIIEGDRRWRVLTASVTYYRGIPGDSIVVLVPKEGNSRWAAVENIIKQGV